MVFMDGTVAHDQHKALSSIDTREHFFEQRLSSPKVTEFKLENTRL